MIDIGQITSDIKKLPPFPDTARKLLDLLNDPTSAMKDLIEVISFDQAVTTNLLRYCNSAYVGLRRKVGSVREAVVLLGQQKLSEIVMAECISTYYRDAGNGYALVPGELWKHSVACALSSQTLTRKLGWPDDPFLFTSALLHDIGKAILSTYVRHEYEKILQAIRESNCTFVEAEKEIIGIDHAQLGSQILTAWNFPTDLIAPIATHHQPKQEDKVSCIVHLCDVMTIMTGIGTGYGLAEHGQDDAMKTLGLTVLELQACMAEVWEELNKAKSLLSVHSCQTGEQTCPSMS